MTSFGTPEADSNEIKRQINRILDEISSYADKMNSSGRHLLTLINDMLEETLRYAERIIKEFLAAP